MPTKRERIHPNLSFFFSWCFLLLEKSLDIPGKIAEDIIYFSGNLEMHEDYTRIIDFLKYHNIHAVYNKKRILRDFGGFIPLTQY